MTEPSELTQGLQPLTYRQVRDFYDFAQQTNPFFKGLSLAEFSQNANAELGVDVFRAGTSTGLKGLAKRWSVGFDKFVEPVSELTGGLSGGLAELLGASPDIKTLSEELGAGLPRGLLETGAAIGGAALAAGTAPVSVPLGIGLLGAGALSAASGGLEKTDSTLVGLIQGGSVAATPLAASLGTRLVSTPLVKQLTMRPVLTRVGDQLLENSAPAQWVSEFARGATQRGLERLGPNVGVTALQEAAIQATSVVQGEGWQNPLTLEHALTLGGANLPFLLIDAAAVLRQPRSLGVTSGGRRVDFQSATEANEAFKYSQVLRARASYEAAHEIDTFLKTSASGRKLLPPVRGRTFNVNEGGDILETPGTTFAKRAPEAVDVGKNVLVPSELFGRWNQALDLTPRRRVFSRDTFKGLQVTDAEADQLMTLMEQRGYLGPLDLASGQRPVLKRVAADDYDLLDQITKTFPRRKPVATTPPQAAPTAPSTVPPAAGVSTTPVSTVPWHSRVIALKQEGKNLQQVFDVLETEGHTFPRTAGSFKQVADVFLKGEIPPPASMDVPYDPMTPIATKERPFGTLTDEQLKQEVSNLGYTIEYGAPLEPVYVRGEPHRTVPGPVRERVPADPTKAVVLKDKEGKVVQWPDNQRLNDVVTELEGRRKGNLRQEQAPAGVSGEPTLVGAPENERPGPYVVPPTAEGGAQTIVYVTPEEALRRGYLPYGEGIQPATFGEAGRSVPVTELSRFHTAWLAKLGAFSRAIAGKVTGRPPVEGPVFPVPKPQGFVEPLGSSRGNEVAQFLAQYDAVVKGSGEEFADIPIEALSPNEVAARVTRLTDTVRELIDEATKAGTTRHEGRVRLKSPAEMESIARGLVDLGYDPATVASRVYQIQIRELNRGLEFLSTEATRALDSLPSLPLEELTQREQNIRAKLARLHELPGEEVGPGRLNMQQELVELTTQRYPSQEVTLTHDPVSGQPIEGGRKVTRPGTRFLRTWVIARQASDANTAGFMDSLYASAVDFMDNREALIAKWKLTKLDEELEGMTPVEIERKVFTKHLLGSSYGTKGQMSGLYGRMVERIRKEAEGREVFEVAAGAKQLPKALVGDEGGLIYSLTPEQEAANAADFEYANSIRSLLNDQLREKMEYTTWAESNMAATGKKAIKVDKVQFTRRFNIALDLLRDGHIGFRKRADGDEIYIVESSEMDRSTVQQMLGFDSERAVRLWLNNEFTPTMQHLVARAKEIMRQGADPKRFLTSTAPPLTEGQRLRTAQAELSGLPPEVESVQTTPDAGLNLVVGSREFFKRFFEAKGVSKDEATGMADIATRIAAMFDKVGYIRVAELVHNVKPGQGSTLGLYVYNRHGYNAFLGLNKEFFLKLPESMQRFMMFTTQGHEIAHGMFDERNNPGMDPVTRKTVAEVRNWAVGMTKDERREVIASLHQIVVPKELQKGYTKNFLDHLSEKSAEDAKEFVANYTGYLVAGLASPDRSVQLRQFSWFLMTNQPAANFAKALFVDLHQLTDAIAAHYDYRDSVIGGHSKVGDTVRFMNSRIKDVLQDLKAVDEAVNTIKQVEMYDPSRYFELVSKATLPRPLDNNAIISWWERMYTSKTLMKESTAPALPRDVIDEARMALGFQSKRELEKAFGVQPRFFERWAYPAAQLAERYPVLKPLFDLAFSYRSYANRLQEQILAPWMTKTAFGRPVLDAERSGLNKAFNDEGINKAITKVALIKNERGFEGEKAGLKGEELANAGMLTDAQMRAFMPELSADRQQAVIDFHRNAEVAMPIAAATTIRSHQATITHQTALRLMLKDKTLGMRQALDLATELVVNSIGMAVTGDPATVAAATAGLTRLQARMTPETFAAGLSTARDLIPHLQRLADHLSGKPWYTPEVRAGQFVVAWKDGARGFDDILSANRYQAELARGGVKANVINKYDKRNQYAGLRDDYVTTWSRIEEASMRRALADFGLNTPEMEEFLRVGYRPGEAVAREMAARGTGKFLLPRKLAQGRETINTAEGVIDYITSIANGMAKQYTREQSGLALNDPTIRDQPQARELARSHLDTVLNPPANEWTAFKNLNFLYFMGFNLSSMMIETSQPLMSLAPFLTRQVFGDKPIGIMGSYKAIADGVSTFVKAMSNKGKFDDPAVQRAVDTARRDQVLDFGILQEFYLNQDNPVANIRHLISGDSAVEKGFSLLKKPLFWYLHSARMLYSLPTRANSHVAFISSFKAAQERGLTETAAYDFAVRTTRATMFGGGAAARPVEPFARSGKYHGAVGAVYSLQSYTFSMIAMMARLAEESIGRVPGMTPADKLGARKAFAQALVTQVAAAGAMGLPLVAGTVALIEQMFPEAEVKKNLRGWLRGLAGEDEKTGQVITDLAMNGMANYFTGLDVSSRLSLGQALGVDSYKGFSVSNLVGPIGGVLENLFRGGSEFARGDFGEGAKAMVPRAFRGLTTLSADDWAFRDKGGRLIDNASSYEQLMYVLGVTPKKVKDYWDESTLTRRSEDIASAQANRFHGELAERLAQGDVQGVREALLLRAREDNGYNPRAGARRVIEVLQDRTTPVDPARHGRVSNAVERSEIARTFAQRPQPTEQERLMQRYQLEATLTGAGSIAPSEMMIAQLVDRLMAANPTLSPQQARLLVERQLHPRQFFLPQGGR